MKTLQVNNLKYLYDKRSTDGVNDISFELESASSLALIGPSGSGKSTTLRLIKGLLSPHSGEINSFGNGIGFVAQHTDLNEKQTVFEFLDKELNYLQDKEKQENQIRATLSTLQITNEIHSKISSISGGQRQRVVIAQALVHSPKILLLDEAFGHLDQVLRFDLMRELFSIFKEKEISTLWVTHDTNEAMAFSDRIMVMNYGKLIQIDLPQTLYNCPKNLFIAKFIGIKNIVITKTLLTKETELTIKIFNKKVSIDKKHHAPNNELVIFFRNDAIKFDEKGAFKGKIQESFYYGSYAWYKLKVGEQTIWLKADAGLNKDTVVNFSVDFDLAHFSNEL